MNKKYTSLITPVLIQYIEKESKLTPTQFARQIGINRGTLWRLKKGWRPINPDLDMIFVNFAEQYKIPLPSRNKNFMESLKSFFKNFNGGVR